jgi:hypothetical protein
MVLLDFPPVSPIAAEPAAVSSDPAPLRRCTVCLSWQPADEIVEINSMIVWCTACALQHPELVPPSRDVVWPIGGFLLGAFVGWLVGASQIAPQAFAGVRGLLCTLVGLAAGLAVGVAYARLSLLNRCTTATWPPTPVPLRNCESGKRKDCE